MYGGKDIRPNQDCFVWFSEKHGGGGLAWHGRVHSVTDHLGKIQIEVDLIASIKKPALTVSNLAPFRDSSDETAMAGLSRKLYKHALNKICSLEPNELDLLLEYF